MEQKTYTPEEIKKKFETLPADIKELVYGADMLNLIQSLGQKYKLHIDQLEILEADTADVMTGFTKTEDFAKNLQDHLGLDGSQASALAKEVNDQLFIKIRDSLKQLNAAPKAAPSSEPAAIAEKSVIMPSKAAATALGRTTGETAQPASPKAPAPQQTAQPQAQTTASGGAPQNAVVPASADPSRQGIAEADVMLTQPTISTPKPVSPDASRGGPPPPLQTPQNAPPKPAPYKTDPYREPPE